ncbi:MAG: HEPN domain-containing protein [Armatimonadetes bacterium]|nr:HEPN domain-containing protein [Armatimonadota bacterium]
MPLPERFSPADPREWLNRAQSNLALARARSPQVYLEDLCFEAQQAAEKAIKAVLMKRDVEFPYVHDLARLLSLLEQAGEQIPGDVRRAVELTPYAIVTRYPGMAKPVSEVQYAEAVKVAEAVVRWAQQRIQDNRPSR